MRSKLAIVEMTLVGVPLPPEKEEAYWAAMELIVEMIVKWIEEHLITSAVMPTM